MRIVLASASPRRADILSRAGFRFETHPVEIDETAIAGESVEECVMRLAGEKTAKAAGKVNAQDAIIVAADTLVALGEEVMGKPASEDDASRMLSRLSGKTHRVVTGIVALRSRDGVSCSGVETTQVSFSPLSQTEIEAYVATGEPLDKAGAYGIQERGGRFVTRIEGCYFNVVGLPLARLCAMLQMLDGQSSD